MSLYENCSTCQGQGSLPCDECKCSTCKATGKVDARCSRCQTGKVQCDRCEGTGKVLEKKGWFSDKYKQCYSCSGSGRVACPACYGTSSVKASCSSCGGSGRAARCSSCGGKTKVTCATCKGAGRFEGQWVKSLQSLPVDRLRFEFEKRQWESSDCKNQTSSVRRAEERLQSDQSEAYDEAASSGPRGIHDFYAGGFESESKAKYREIARLEKRVGELEAEMSAIQQVIDSKWK